MHADDATRVRLESAQALSGTPIPQPCRVVHGSRQKLSRVVKLQAPDTGRMASEGPDFLSRFNVPHLDRRVVRARDEHVLIKLQAHDPVGVASEHPGRAATIFPVCPDLEPILVDILPWPDSRFLALLLFAQPLCADLLGVGLWGSSNFIAASLEPRARRGRHTRPVRLGRLVLGRLGRTTGSRFGCESR